MATDKYAHQQKEAQRFYGALGQCINKWAYIERFLFECCHAALGTDEKRASIVYYRIHSFAQKLQLTDEMMLCAFEGEPLLDDWNDITTKIRQLSEFRNKVVHSPVNIVVPVGTAYDPPIDDLAASNIELPSLYYRIVPEQKELIRGKRKPFEVLHSDLIDHMETLAKLQSRLVVFVQTLRGKK